MKKSTLLYKKYKNEGIEVESEEILEGWRQYLKFLRMTKMNLNWRMLAKPQTENS